MELEEQKAIVVGFLEGLFDAYGFAGQVESRIEDDEVIVVSITGDQTEALVGPKGSVLEAVHELCRTVLQRQARNAARVRLDIAGYAERRREALKIYAMRLADQSAVRAAR